MAGTSTTASKGEETLGLIDADGGAAMFTPADVRRHDEMREVVAAAVERYGGLDIVVHSAGVRTNGAVTEISEEDWDRTLDTNLKGVFNVCRHAIPEMARRGGGVIINIAARSGMMGQAGRAAYCASKGGMVRLTEAMARTTPARTSGSTASAPVPTGLPWWTRRRRKRWHATLPGYRWAASESPRT